MHIFFEENMIGYRELKAKLENMFNEAGIDDYADIDWIMCEVLNTKRSMLPRVQDISDADLNKIMECANKRINHIPLGYIFGKTNFYGYDLMVNENVLIPRLDTEILIETAIKEIKNRVNPVVLDIGTGSGAIAITLNKETSARTIAVDVSEKALEVAKHNAEINDADVEFIKSNLFENIANLKVDFIVSNPPYIETSVIDGLDIEVRDNEPILALDGGEDGLDSYRQIAVIAPRLLEKDGYILLEVGEGQAEDVVAIFQKQNFRCEKIVADLSGINRCIVLKK